MDQTALSRLQGDDEPLPGALLLFSASEPLLGVIPNSGQEFVMGRSGSNGVKLRDSCMSRTHASVTWDEDRFIVRDLGSRNGTYVNGERLEGSCEVKERAVLRTGETLTLLVTNLRAYLEHTIQITPDRIVGPTLAGAMQQVARAAQGNVVHVTGETGAGKEVAARHFHKSGPGRNHAFVAVNCAAIPEGVAERLLFGAKKGAYSGAAGDVVGYVQEADGGTLFLDEVGELDLNVQAKLLRVLETQEVLPLGATRPTQVAIQLCSATHRDLRDAVAAGRFREDLYYRLGRPSVTLPPLRDRPEEIAFLIDRQLRAVDPKLTAHASLIERALLLAWPGNHRELLAEMKEAALEAVARGKTVVKANHLQEDAGASTRESRNSLGRTGAHSPSSAGSSSLLPPTSEIEDALRECTGKVATAARKLGVHRNQLRRWLEKNHIDPQSYSE